MTLAAFVATDTLRLGSRGEAVTALQNALRQAGAELVPDGEFGRMTYEATKRFQGTHGLDVDGFVGPLTAAALDAVPAAEQVPANNVKPAPSVLKVAPQLSVMRSITGVKEFQGGGDNPVILHWRDEIARLFPEFTKYCREYTHDAIPWCGLTVAYCCAASGMRPVDGFLWAADWLNFGERVDKARLQPGDVLVFTRAGGGHVALYESEDATHYTIRGGNQSDMVNVVRKSKAQFTGATRPRGTAGLFAGVGAVGTAAAGKES